MYEEKRHLLNDVTALRSCSSVARGCVPRIHIWPPRRDERSGVPDWRRWGAATWLANITCADGTFAMLHESNTRLCKLLWAIFERLCKHVTNGFQLQQRGQCFTRAVAAFVNAKGSFFNGFKDISLVGVSCYSVDQKEVDKDSLTINANIKYG